MTVNECALSPPPPIEEDMPSSFIFLLKPPEYSSRLEHTEKRAVFFFEGSKR